MRWTIRCGFALCLTAPALADAPDHGAKFTLDETVLTFDTESIDDQPDAEIAYGDHDRLLKLLKANPDIDTLRLNSQGGKIYAAYRMADVVIDYGLTTQVDGVCASACAYVFLGGARREMTRGSRIGFHQRTWSAADISAYYDRWRKDEGWSTLFDFASWLYVDTQHETYEELQFYLERGVDAAFAIETLQDRGGSMWYPRRAALEAAGVLTPADPPKPE